ncbi:CoA ester lyase [Candidatus Acetothermia bacterium]|jgi:citrate lyase subunit beta/citryl-CoA lyase|nr:CoA ester lyase [Candidatus Acetothermia bacterium]MCI2427088.1 CoA ester lyase [Candidatus Acetothermia bacterium]MCI2428268.1 CoA ester lyase [Candidatus Acetothermia bacterium]
MVLRSLLFAPGNVSRRVEKALHLNADAVILDLEDAVPLTEKRLTRELIAAALNQPRNSRCYVRVNALSTGLTIDDLTAVVSPQLDGIILPKAEEAEDLSKVDWYLSYLEDKRSLPIGSIDLIPLVENAKGIRNAYIIATAVQRVKRLCFGAIDYTADINVQLSVAKMEILYARSSLVNASAAAALESPIDTVYPNIRDIDGLRADTIIARGLGFQGKLVIHPDQIEPVNEIFSPSEEEITYAERVVAAFEQAEAAGHAAITLDDGKFIDYPVVRNAQRLLAVAAAIRKIRCKATEIT